jgi:SAM-dependent methyltransferase
MAEHGIRFEDGAAYQELMGIWSRLAGEIFLDWLAPPLGLRWIDVGCGNGAFTELLIERCAPAEVHGIDPSEGQLAFARTRSAARMATFHRGDALKLPFPAQRFDAAVMALVVVFLPNPAKGIEEMVRVVRPGGMVASYIWDLPGGGFPLDPLIVEMRAMNLPLASPPEPGASQMQALRDLWHGAGIEIVDTREITVHRTFTDFEEFWRIALTSSSGRSITALPSGEIDELKGRVRERLAADGSGRITRAARANAIKGQVSKP